ncbi:unnamed protein product [Onchocerca flexuosa]|uniref:Secreted protein n=1 Tax=Onchocerca flexuosa TaxID=387005 RepID=A0A183HBC3_9BILA|nr:unnamed protein product [Onchocerca flexuosa]
MRQVLLLPPLLLSVTVLSPSCGNTKRPPLYFVSGCASTAGNDWVAAPRGDGVRRLAAVRSQV